MHGATPLFPNGYSPSQLVRSRWRRASVSTSARNILATVPCNTREEAFSDERRESRYFLNPKDDRQFTKSNSLTNMLAGSQSLTDIGTVFEVWL
jgi:hypothetical protein